MVAAQHVFFETNAASLDASANLLERRLAIRCAGLICVAFGSVFSRPCMISSKMSGGTLETVVVAYAR